MGYGYGVWLIIDDDKWTKTKHVPHVTIACFMNYEDAYSLYNDILEIMMTTKMSLSTIKDPIIFDNKMYPDDDDKLMAWGYNLTCDYWSIFRAMTIVYNCNFSHIPHTTVEYDLDSNSFNLEDAPLDKINCTLAVVNINSDNPSEWKKI